MRRRKSGADAKRRKSVVVRRKSRRKSVVAKNSRNASGSWKKRGRSFDAVDTRQSSIASRWSQTGSATAAAAAVAAVPGSGVVPLAAVHPAAVPTRIVRLADAECDWHTRTCAVEGGEYLLD